MPVTPTQIVDMAMAALLADLIQHLQTDVANDDLSKAMTVKTGLFQEDPTESVVYVQVQPNDPTDLGNTWDHTVADPGEANKLGMHVNYPTREVGEQGGLWWRRGIVKLGIYYVGQNLTEQEAQTHAHKVLGRAEYYINHCTAALGLTDEFEELSLEIQVVRSRMTQGGGAGDWIWRGTVWWQLLTGKSELEI